MPRPTRPDGADLVVLNTCHIREKAAEKVYSELGRLRELQARARAPRARACCIAVAGCVAQAEGEEIMRRAPAVDLVVGPAGLSSAARAAGARAQRGAAARVLDTDFPAESKFDDLPAQRRASRGARPS